MIPRVSVGVHAQNLLHLFLQVAVSDEGSGRATSWCDSGATWCDLVQLGLGGTLLGGDLVSTIPACVSRSEGHGSFFCPKCVK